VRLLQLELKNEPSNNKGYNVLIRWLKQREMRTSSRSLEKWFLETASGKKEYPMSVLHHKPMDILGLKQDIVKNFQRKIDERNHDKAKWMTEENLERVSACPICGSSTQHADAIMDLTNTRYVCCRQCQHVYLLKRLTRDALERYFKSDLNVNCMYADPEISQKRIEEVAKPKLNWAIDQYKNQYGEVPESILDIGSGAGHFVQAAREYGLAADGIEISESSRTDCKKLFGFDLINTNFYESDLDLTQYDLITFWGVLGLIYSPTDMLSKAFDCLRHSEKGMLIASVPKWNSFGTSVQNIHTDTIIRHMNVLGHIHIYSESSLATAFVNAGFSPCGAWYYGMDIYEFLMQLSYLSNIPSLPEKTAQYINPLQMTIDHAGLSDEIALAGTI